MFVLGNSYQLRDLKKEIFDEYSNTENTISHFVSVDDYHVYSSKNELYSLRDGKHKKIAVFKADLTCLTSQKGLVCAGTLHGEIQIFSDHRASIRRFHKHTAEVTDVIITQNDIVISSGKDAKINMYSLLEDKVIECIDLNGKVPKKILVYNEELFVFTNDILIYSLTNCTLKRKISIGMPIDNAVFLSNDNLLIICKNKGHIIDLTASKIIKSHIMHTRQITSLDLHENRIYTSSLDGHFKSFNMSLVPISDFNMHKRLVSFTIRNNIPFIACESGKIFTIKKEKPVEEQRKHLKKAPAYEDDIEYVTVGGDGRKLTEIEMLLKNYEYKGAFSKCFESNNLKRTFAILKHISDKRAFMRVLKDADSEFLKNTLQLCLETIKIEEFTSFIIEILIIATSVYFEDFSENDEFSELINQISDEIDHIAAFEQIFLEAFSFSESFSKV